MLPKHILEQILWVVNDPSIWEAFTIMINNRLETLRIQNDTVVGHDEFLKNQGAIRELKELLNLQKRIVAEHAKGGVVNAKK